MMGMKIGELLVNNNLVSELQVAEALSQKMLYPSMTLGQVLCQMGYITRADLDHILNHFRKRQKMGEILVKRRILDEKKLSYALAVSKEDKSLLGQTLLKLQYIEEEQLAHCIAAQYDLPSVSLKNLIMEPELAVFFNYNFAHRHRIVAISRVGKTVTLAMAFPLDKQQIKEIERAANVMVNPVIACETEIMHAQNIVYGKLTEVNSTREDLNLEIYEDSARELGKSKYVDDVITERTEQLLRNIMTTGIGKLASDIHLERTEAGLSIRYRIDGILQSVNLGVDAVQINSQARALVAKIKVLCDMDIAEKRRPQDGSFKMRVSNQKTVRIVDFRVSTLLTSYGEDVVIRILDKRGGAMSLALLGLAPTSIEAIHSAMETPTGIFLVTGPTGAGKSATLHALLAHINRPGVKSITVEDPIEYTLDGVRQTEVNEAIGNSFSCLLRTFMRQDPDNIMIGEIRDTETAALAIRAALTGHTILSSLQTNDATSAVTCLMDMGIEPNLIATALRGVIAQRLVRINCEVCKEQYEPAEQVLSSFGVAADELPDLYHGQGCPNCNFTGFNGRRPIVELWLPTAEELLLIGTRPDNIALRSQIFSCAQRRTMLEDGLGRVKRGETTLEELMRVVPYGQIAEVGQRLKGDLFSGNA